MKVFYKYCLVLIKKRLNQLSMAKIANLHNFILNELPLKYETKIGERV